MNHKIASRIFAMLNIFCENYETHREAINFSFRQEKYIITRNGVLVCKYKEQFLSFPLVYKWSVVHAYFTF